MEPKWPFTARMVASAPDIPGVFSLWEDRELIYIGRATQALRTVLLDHLEGKDPCTRNASHYAWQLALDPATRERDLLVAYEEKNRALPRCNRKK